MCKDVMQKYQLSVIISDLTIIEAQHDTAKPGKSLIEHWLFLSNNIINMYTNQEKPSEQGKKTKTLVFANPAFKAIL